MLMCSCFFIGDADLEQLREDKESAESQVCNSLRKIYFKTASSVKKHNIVTMIIKIDATCNRMHIDVYTEFPFHSTLNKNNTHTVFLVKHTHKTATLTLPPEVPLVAPHCVVYRPCIYCCFKFLLH